MANHTKKQEELRDASEILKKTPGYNPSTGKVMQSGSGALGLISGVAGKAAKMLNFANIRSAVKQYVGKGKVPTKPRLVDQYHTVDRGAIKKFNQITKDASGGGSRPLIINNKIITKMPTSSGGIGGTGTKPVSNYTYHGPNRARIKELRKEAQWNPAAKTFLETGKTPTQVFRETGKNTTKDLEAYFAKKYDSPSGYYTPDVKLMGKGRGAPQ